MTADSTVLLRRQGRAKLDGLSGRDFRFFLRRVLATVSPQAAYQHNWHIEAIGEYLAACERGEIKRLLINLPPRMLKSTLVSVAWPAWLLGQRPGSRMLVASYAQSLAVKHSLDCRLVVRAPWYARVFPETKLSDEQNEKDRFVTTARGHRIAVSVGGAATGEGGDILIVDDPLNPLQASSRTQREATNQWFDATFLTRLDDKQRGAIVVVMQRLHEDDLSGHVLRKGGWEHLCLPAITNEHVMHHVGDYRYVREAGTALHGAREPLALLEQMKHELGSVQFSAQYQQAPQRLSGSIIKREWFVRFELTEFLS